MEKTAIDMVFIIITTSKSRQSRDFQPYTSRDTSTEETLN